MERNIYGIFVAGGSGTRMGSELPKQFILLDGTPILMRTISSFVQAIPGLRIITVLPQDCFALWKELCLAHDFNVPQHLVAGGITRFHSVRNALVHVPDQAVALIQDGVRPFASGALVRSLAEAAAPGRGAIPVVPLVDTLRHKDGSMPDPDRSAIVAVQTPQAFVAEDIKAAYDQPFDKAFTDDASVAAAHGLCVAQLPGERFNIKITTPEDLSLAAYILTLPKA